MLHAFRHNVGLSIRIVFEQHYNLNKMLILFSFCSLIVTTGYRSVMTSRLTLSHRLPFQYETAANVLAANYTIHCDDVDTYNFKIASEQMSKLIPGVYKGTFCIHQLEMEEITLRPRLPQKFAGVLSFTDQNAKVFLKNLKLWNPQKSCKFVKKDVAAHEVYFTHWHHQNFKSIKVARLFLEIGIYKRFENVYEVFSMGRKTNLASQDAELSKSVRELGLTTILKLRGFIPALYILIGGLLLSCVVYLVEDVKGNFNCINTFNTYLN